MISLNIFKSTARHKKYWINRRIDWHQAYFNPDHEHRILILKELEHMRFSSVLEVGCASGANLWRIVKQWPRVSVGGVDLSADAIEEAKRMLPKFSALAQGGAEDLFLSGKSVDVAISDMCLIYLSPKRVRTALLEMKRVARYGVVLCEFHSKSWFKKMALRLASGYFAHNYEKILDELGFYDIEIKKIEEEYWPGGEPQKTFGFIIRART